jgi:hypothetical protein
MPDCLPDPASGARQKPGVHMRIVAGAHIGASSYMFNVPTARSCKQMPENPFAPFGLERAISLRWALRDIQARRLKMSPVSDEDLRTLTDLGLVEERDSVIVLTQAAIVMLNGS